MESITIYHNPRCGKSRATLELLKENGIEPRVIEYLKTPPNAGELKTLCSQLGVTPGALVRKSEEIYKTEYADKTLSDAEWLEALACHPILIERPIVVRGSRAAIGRPPENVLPLLR